MPTFELTTTDGKRYRIDADTPEAAQKSFDYQFGVAPTSFADRLAGIEKTPLIPSPSPDQAGLLPIRKTPTGPAFDPTAGVLGSLLRAITTPGDVYRGNLQTPYETGEPNQDLARRAVESASLISPASPASRAGERFGTINVTAPVPGSAAIKTAAGQGFDAVRQSGWEVPSTSVQTTAQTATQALTPNFTPTDAPRTWGRLAQMADPARSSTSIAELMSHYDALTDIIGRGGADGKAARVVRDQISSLINDLPAAGARPAAGMTPTMAPEEVATTLQTARANTRSAASAERITGLLDEVENRAQARGDFNIAPKMRMGAVKILEDTAAAAALMPEERAALESIVKGTATANTMRFLAKRFSSSNPLTLGAASATGAGAGALLGGPVAAATMAAGVPITGALAGGASNALTRRALQAAEELTRRNSPLYQGVLDALRQSPGPITRDQTVLRGLLPGFLAPPASDEQRITLDPTRKLPPGFI